MYLMITAFEPFAGRSQNSSFLVAQRLQAYLQSMEWRVDIVLLPVVYDIAAQELKLFFQRITQRPTVVISIGEGGEKIRFEKYAYNFDDTPDQSDNAGQVRVQKKIVEGEVDRVELQLPVEKMYAKMSEDAQKRVEISSNIGNFVCNNTAFLMQPFFAKLQIPYGFIHVPPIEKYGPEIADADMVARILLQMIPVLVRSH